VLREFKEFALKGNVVDLAIGVIIGGAFGKIVTSFVGDIIMPLVSMVTGKINFQNLYISLSGDITLRYGIFITQVIDFLLMAFVIFLMVKFFNKLSKLRNAEKEETPAARQCPYCITEIDCAATRCPHCTSQLDKKENDHV